MTTLNVTYLETVVRWATVTIETKLPEDAVVDEVLERLVDQQCNNEWEGEEVLESSYTINDE